MRKLLVTILFGLLSVSISAQTRDYTRYVDPFIGTGGNGHTFPGATVPFGMVQLSPDTRLDNWGGSSGYSYSDNTIYGFSHTHLSGTGIPDYCDILFMPTLGDPQFEANDGDKSVNGYASRFSHDNERAEPGYYSVKLDDDGIFAEMTATKRVGLHRYTFPAAGKANIILDLKWRDKVLDSRFTVIGNNRIEGFRRSSSWAKDQIVYFAAEFSKPFDGVMPDGAVAGGTDYKGRKLKAAFRFKTKEGEKILLKVAISPVSIDGARKNLAAELPGWNFEKVRADAKAAWNKELSKIEVAGGTAAQTTNFYTALYHTMVQPNIFQDVDKSYPGADGKIYRAGRPDAAELQASKRSGETRDKGRNELPAGSFSAGDNYTVFSLWDTFRAAHPLYTIIDQKRTTDFINSFIRRYEQGGRLPVWELWGSETDTMIGYHAVSVIADAMAKGIKGFDYEKAYEAAKYSADLEQGGLAAYKKRGYISAEDENESVSKTLEYAYDDWCIARMAAILAGRAGTNTANASVTAGVTTDSARRISILKSEQLNFEKRAQYFQNLFDAETGFFRAKKNGGFVRPFAPNEVTFNYTEANAWQYAFFVPQDVTQLIELMGGREKFARKLDELFTTETKLAGREQPDITGLIGQYAHGNEPSHHIAYLYDYAGQPWKTQKYVRQILDNFYKPTPDGLIGNEDCGQMSAWYVLSASGFYPVTPGSEIYAIGTPLFPQIKYNLENGRTFTVRAVGVSAQNFYIQSARLGGVPYSKAFITQRDLMNGGVIEFRMGASPAENAFAEMPASGISDRQPAVPVIDGPGRSFTGKSRISLSTISRGAKIFYTTDGSIPTTASTPYTSAFEIDQITNVQAIAAIIGPDENPKSVSPIAEALFIKKPNDWTVKIESKYNRQYTGGGDDGLIDGIRGTLNFASGEWQGYQPQDFSATIDLQRATEIRKVGGGFLQNARSWIWMPTRIEFEVSNDNVNFRKVAEIKTDVPPEDMTPVIRDYTADIAPVTARYVRVRAYNLGKIPAWHPGAGDAAFIFVDEIFVR